MKAFLAPFLGISVGCLLVIGAGILGKRSAAEPTVTNVAEAIQTYEQSAAIRMESLLREVHRQASQGRRMASFEFLKVADVRMEVEKLGGEFVKRGFSIEIAEIKDYTGQEVTGWLLLVSW